MISGIIKVEVSVISRSRRLRLITLTETLIILDITKTESNNCFIIQAILIFFYYRSHSYFAVRELDIAPGNHALHAQPTDLFTNL